MDVSVIIPVYNGEHSILASLDSLVRQTHKDFEVVIVNDGSVDSTESVVKEYSSHGLKINYVYQDNGGVAAARNKGLDLATGEYVCFLDADDYYESRFIEQMYTEIKSSNSDICYCGYNCVTPQRTFRRRTQFWRNGVLLGYILGKVAVQTTAWMYSRDFLMQHHIRFPVGVSWGEDFEFCCEALALTNRVTFVKEYLTNYRSDFDPNQLSAFSMDKLDKDYESVQRLVNNPIVNSNPEVERALVDYRLSAALVYRLVAAMRKGVKHELISSYAEKYAEHIQKLTWNNGLRSIKLNAHRIRLKRYLRSQSIGNRDALGGS
mgnify:CR=1 FL=1